MSSLLLSLAALASAPAIDALSRHRPGAEAVLDGLVQAVVLGVVLLIVLPFGLEAAGPVALLALAGGAVVSQLLHQLPGLGAASAGLAVAALLLHALMDGAALAAPMGEHAPLAAAVVLHVLPVGLAAWRLARVRAGARVAGLLLLSTGAAMAAGFGATRLVADLVQDRAAALVLCTLAGALLSVLHHAPARALRWAEALGSLLGLGVVLALLQVEHLEHQHHGVTHTPELVGPPLLLGLLALRLFFRRGGGDVPVGEP
ncbi:MAG: hypothetical protein H6741_00605 [Alphaproteobacteria bacterium]|nr:hypothetical protein [Alphaproteobacteria bacterium]MCB9791205.1 hypothetical protein [Alphaproteobacteria bacterium]